MSLTTRPGRLAALFLMTALVAVPAVASDARDFARPPVTASDDPVPVPDRNIHTLVRHESTAELRTNGVVTDTFDIEQTSPLIVDGSEVDDTLVVDFSRGNPIPPGGLIYHGNSQVTGFGDVLRLEGGSAESITHSYHNANDGTIDIDGKTLIFTGLEPVLDLIPAATLTVNGTNARNSITISNGVLGGSEFRVAVDGFETIDAANKQNLVVNGNDGSDEISVDLTNAPASLVAVSVVGGSGEDSIAVNSGLQVPLLTIFGGLGDDYARVVPSGVTSIDFNGGDQLRADYLVIRDTTGTASNSGLLVSIAGFMDIGLANVERAAAHDGTKSRPLPVVP